MAVNHSEIRDVLFRYLEHYRYPPEANQLIRLVRALDEGHDVTSRTEYRIGHLTVGAVIIDRARRVLLVRHSNPDRWLIPSGAVGAIVSRYATTRGTATAQREVTS